MSKFITHIGYSCKNYLCLIIFIRNITLLIKKPFKRAFLLIITYKSLTISEAIIEVCSAGLAMTVFPASKDETI